MTYRNPDARAFIKAAPHFLRGRGYDHLPDHLLHIHDLTWGDFTSHDLFLQILLGVGTKEREEQRCLHCCLLAAIAEAGDLETLTQEAA